MKKATWVGPALAGAALAVALFSGLGTRLHWWHFRTGFTLLKAAFWMGAAGLLLCGRALRVRPLAALIGLALALPAAGLPLVYKLRAKRAPMIHDITTDPQDPPRFKAVLARREGSSNSPEYGGAEVAAAQKAAYPDIAPKLLESPEDQAFERALQSAKDMGWEIVSADPVKGVIEATAATFWFGFRDDVAIRVRPEAGMSRVDVRSASRVGKSDLGANAARVRSYLRRLGR